MYVCMYVCMCGVCACLCMCVCVGGRTVCGCVCVGGCRQTSNEGSYVGYSLSDLMRHIYIEKGF